MRGSVEANLDVLEIGKYELDALPLMALNPTRLKFEKAFL